MHIGLEYDDEVWADFKKMARDKYGLDGTAALKRLIDYAVRNRDIPDIRPLLGATLYIDGDYFKKEKPDGTKIPNEDNRRTSRLDKKGSDGTGTNPTPDRSDSPRPVDGK